jgi:hypothetical protein
LYFEVKIGYTVCTRAKKEINAYANSAFCGICKYAERAMRTAGGRNILNFILLLFSYFLRFLQQN